jgi:hypothetical protein
MAIERGDESVGRGHEDGPLVVGQKVH